MSVFLDTRGRPSLAIAICDRCSRKFPIDELRPDGNSPGLRVCAADRDVYDPWRLPARAPDQISLRYPRPDTPLDVVALSTAPPGDTLLLEDGSYLVQENDFYIPDSTLLHGGF